jgi:hypothetical protein
LVGPAAELVINAKNPGEAHATAEALEDPFSDRLKDEFGGEFRPGNYGIEGDPATDSKLELLKLTIGNPKQKQEIIDRWIKLFPGDKKWADLLR